MYHPKTIKIIILAAFLLFGFYVKAFEFEVISFKKDAKDLAALRYPKQDINGNKCAIIKVFTDVSGVQFDCNMGFTDVIKKAGEYWLYVSPGEQRLKFIKADFISRAYRIPISIEASKVYHLVLRRKNPGYKKGKGSLSLTSKPSGAKVMIDGYPDLQKETPCVFENYRAGTHLFILKADRYEKRDTLLRIDKGKEKEVSVQLKPAWADLILKSNIRGTEYYIDGRYTGQGKELVLTGSTNAPKAGKVELSVRHPKYFNEDESINLISGQVNREVFHLTPRIGSLKVDSRPVKASVYIDGDFAGYTPLEKDSLLIGEYSVKVKKKKYVVFNDKVTVETNSIIEMAPQLVNKARLHIKTIPDGAHVFVDGTQVGKAPLQTLAGVGQHNVRVTKPDFESKRVPITIDDEKESVTIKLIPEKQQVRLDAMPHKAQIKINGKKCGKTPLDTNLRPGEYDIAFSDDIYWNINRTIQIDDEPVKNTYRLKPSSFGAIGYSYGLESQGGEITIGFGHWSFGFQYANLPQYSELDNPEITVSPGFVGQYAPFMDDPIIKTGEVTEGGGPTTGEMYQFKAGYTIYYPLPMVFYVGLGSRQFSSYQKIYQVNEGFEGSQGTYFGEGSYVGLADKEKSVQSLVVGGQLFLRFLKLGGLYIGADYWLHTEPPVQRKYVLNIGLFTN